MIAELRSNYPGIEYEIVASDEPSDLLRREADIAIRNFRPQEPDLVAKKVRDMEGHLYAASSYLDRIGRPQTPAELSAAQFIGFDRSDRLIERLRELRLNLTQSNFALISTNQLVGWELVKQGLGVGVNSDVVGDAEPGVERALPSLPPITFPVWLVSHREIHSSRRVRVVFDHLVEWAAGI